MLTDPGRFNPKPVLLKTSILMTRMKPSPVVSFDLTGGRSS